MRTRQKVFLSAAAPSVARLINASVLPSVFFTVQLLSGQILVGSVDCQRFQTFCQSQGVRAYPEIRLYPGNARQPDRYMYVPDFKMLIMYRHLIICYTHIDISGHWFSQSQMRRWTLVSSLYIEDRKSSRTCLS